MTAAGQWPHVVVLEPWSAGLAVSRQMVRAGARVSVLTSPEHRWEAYSRGVERLILPRGPDDALWLRGLERLSTESQDVVLLPCTDRSSEMLVKAGPRLPPNLQMFERTGQAHSVLMDKETADGIARRAGVKVPWTTVISTTSDLGPALAEAPWPCVLKPALSHVWRMRYGEHRTFLVTSPDAALDLTRRPLEDGLSMLLCQYIPGADDAVEEAIVVRRDDGSYPVSFGCRKLRQFPPGFGMTALGESAHLPETMEIAQRVLDGADFVGVAGVETKRHAETGERWFLEVNVRLPAQWGLGDACGIQATRRLVSVMMDRPVGPQPNLRPGVRFVSPGSDLDACRAILRPAVWWRRPALALRLVRPYLGAGELGLLDPRDPAPGLAWIATVARRRVARVLRRLGWRSGPR